MVTGTRQVVPGTVQRIRELVAAVPDPELPMLTIGDLGILRNVEVRPPGAAGTPSHGAGNRNHVAGEPRENRDGPGSQMAPDPDGRTGGTVGSGNAAGGAPETGGRAGQVPDLEGEAGATQGLGDAAGGVLGTERGAGELSEPAGWADGTSGPGDEAGGGPGRGGADSEGSEVVVGLTPTYSGCPALEVMRRDVRGRLADAGFGDVEIRTVLDPPWSSDWITTEGRRKLAAAGIAPPGAARRRATGPVPVTLSRRPPDVACPRCGSRDTVEMSAFGSTACKSLRRCRACAEPFEHVKEI